MEDVTLESLAARRKITATGDGSNIRAYDFKSFTTKNTKIVLPVKKVSIINGQWKDVEFVAAQNHKVEFIKSEFDTVKIQGGEQGPHVCLSDYSISEAAQYGISVSGDFGVIEIATPHAQNIPLTKFCQSNQVKNRTVKFSNCIIEGKFGSWHQGDHGVFQDCVWNLTIQEYIILKDSKFPESTVYISDWVNRCQDRSKIDFQVAKKVIDKWGELRDEYTGVRLYLCLVLVFAFFMPYAVKAFFYLLAG